MATQKYTERKAEQKEEEYAAGVVHIHERQRGRQLAYEEGSTKEDKWEKYHSVGQRLSGLVDTQNAQEMIFSPAQINEMMERAHACQCGGHQCSNCCPQGKPISETMHAILDASRDDPTTLRRAFDIEMRASPFIGITGTACPAPCESGCTKATSYGGNGDPVKIRSAEYNLYLLGVHQGWFDGYFQDPTQLAPTNPHYVAPTGKQVAIVGTGPAGMQAAFRLRQQGHDVVMFEKQDHPGGLLTYGIPDHKLEKHVVDFYFEKMQAMGIQVRTGVHVTRADLAGFDSTVLAVGVADAPRLPELEGMERVKTGVVQAIDYLTEANKEHRARLATADGEEKAPYQNPLNLRGQRVAVLGRADTGEDAIRTVLKQQHLELGHADGQILTFDRNPQKQERRPIGNNWPKVRETASSHAMEEELEHQKGQTYYQVQPVGIASNEQGQVTGIRVKHLKPAPGSAFLHKPDREMQHDTSVGEGGFSTIPVDQVVLAMGFGGPERNPLVRELGLTTESGRMQPVRHHRTSVEHVYMTGDAHKPSTERLIIWAMADADSCAAAVGHDLLHQPAWEHAQRTPPKQVTNAAALAQDSFLGAMRASARALDW